MIPATPGAVAVFHVEGDTYNEPVLAWDEDGHPMVIGDGDVLIRARQRDHFDHINADATAPPTIIAATPGWWAKLWTTNDLVPVVAWIIDWRGDGTAIVLVNNRTRTLWPDEEESIAFYDPTYDHRITLR